MPSSCPMFSSFSSSSLSWTNYQCSAHSHDSSPEIFLLACFFQTFVCVFLSYICMVVCMRFFFIHWYACLYVFFSYICMRVFVIHLYAILYAFLSYICLRFCMCVFLIHLYASFHIFACVFFSYIFTIVYGLAVAQWWVWSSNNQRVGS